MVGMKAHYATFARYNAWANRRLYDAAAKLSDADYRAAREAEDRRIIAYIDGLSEEQLKGVIRYRRVSTPEEFVQPLAPALAHWFNHQTHHRGQAHMILTSLGTAPPELDLLYFQRLSDAGQA